MAERGETLSETPVLIVGAGPVGLGLAVDLGWRGVPCLVVEQGDGGFVFPRANAINVRTMEFCRRWGIADDVRAAAVPPDYPHTALYVTSLAGHEITRIERPGHGGNRPSQFSPEQPQRCNQLFFDPVLLRRARSFPHIRVRHRCRFDTFARKGDGVVAELIDLVTGATESVDARYLIACCGGHSGIRNQLGITLEGLPEAGTPVHIFFRIDALWNRHDKGKAALHYLMGPEGRWATLINVNGNDLWSLSVEIPGREGEISMDEARAYLDRALGTPMEYEIRSISYWVRREMVADGYGGDPVFIAGDCAHLNGPEGGYGMNTGMGDAVDLGWKLCAALEGWGGPGLLANYETERRAVALRNVAEATRNLRNHEFNAPDILRDTPEGAEQRQRIGQQIEQDGQRRHGHNGLALGYRYESPLICRPTGSEPPEDDPATFVPSAYPGRRAPHAWLADGRSTIDIFGKGFTLLRIGNAPPDASALRASAVERNVPLKTVVIDDSDIRALYDADLVLVRPDGHVAWSGDEPPADPLALIDRVRGA